jgi:nitrite reductase (NADH) large subunit
VRATDLLCKVETEAEVLEYSAAFIQLYREEARYLDRTAPWIERVGFSYVKENIAENAEKRKQLAERFRISQQENETQDDPWAMRSTEGRDQEQFVPLKVIA